MPGLIPPLFAFADKLSSDPKTTKRPTTERKVMEIFIPKVSLVY